MSNTIITRFPTYSDGIYYVAVEFDATQKFSRPVRFCWNDLSDRFTAFGYDRRLASTGNFIDKRKAVGLKLAGGYRLLMVKFL